MNSMKNVLLLFLPYFLFYFLPFSEYDSQPESLDEKWDVIVDGSIEKKLILILPIIIYIQEFEKIWR